MRHVLFLMMTLTLVSAPALMCEPIKTDAAAYQSNGTVMVPMRAIFEWLGAEVSFDTATGMITAKRGEQAVGMITAKRGEQVVSLKAGSKTATVNGETKTMSASAESRNGRTFVPVRFVAEAFGAKVKWDPKVDSGREFALRQGEVYTVDAFLDVTGGLKNRLTITDQAKQGTLDFATPLAAWSAAGGPRKGNVVFVSMEAVRDRNAGMLTPQPAVNSANDVEILVELDDGTLAAAVCSAKLLRELPTAGRVEIKITKRAGWWRVVQILN